MATQVLQWVQFLVAYTHIVADSNAVPLALTMGFVLPSVIGLAWKDPVGTYIYGGLVSRLLSVSSASDVSNAADTELTSMALYFLGELVSVMHPDKCSKLVDEK